jgi:hypothetical protein
VRAGRVVVVLVAIVFVGCSGEIGLGTDAGSTPADAARGPSADSGSENLADSGAAGDAEAADAGPQGPGDAAAPDSGRHPPDAGHHDAGHADAGAHDAGAPADSGFADAAAGLDAAAAPDAASGQPDAAGQPDATSPDATVDDAALPDAALLDAAAPLDATPADAVPEPDAAVPPADAGLWPDAAPQSDAAAQPDAAPAPDSGPAMVPVIGGCQVFPADHIFNTPIDSLPAHPDSVAFMNTIGAHNFHLDLGATVDQTSPDYYGIPYNVVQGSAVAWQPVRYYSADSSLNWDPTAESDCANGAAHTLVSPCVAASAPNPVFPIPAMPLVEGGIDTDPTQPYGDHHILLVDSDSCRLWELYHSYPDATTGWDIFGSASFDLGSNALRPTDWSSADAAGFPMMPLLLKADEADSGAIHHALRFTIQSSKIRTDYVWPARHLTTNGTGSLTLPPMGQLFRVKSSYTIPANFTTQARAILQAMKTYGMYIADGGSDMYVSGEPNAAWLDATISQLASVSNSWVEAVDLSPIMSRAGFDSNSAAVPPP